MCNGQSNQKKQEDNSTAVEKQTMVSSDMGSNNVLSIAVLICINTMDSIMGAIIGPTLIFYINDLGGDNAILGWMSTVSTISSMIMISIYGKWVDTNGNKYRQPYLFSFAFGVLWSLMYFVAILFPKGPIALSVLLLSQFFAGIAGSGRTLAYTWVASAIPQEQQRNVLTLMSSSRTLGMVLGPLSNFLVSEIHTEINLFGITIPINPYNAIGLLIAAGEMILAVIMLLFLEEPPEKKEEKKVKMSSLSKKVEVEEKGILYALSHFDIFLPIFTIFAMVACFLLPGLCLPPVARNLGWNTVEISTISSAGSILMAIAMALSAAVSMTSIPDAGLIIGGECGFIIGGLITYIWWSGDVNYWELALPMYFIMFSYPFIGPANRSKFTRAIHDKKELEGCQGVLMGVMQQAAALPGLIGPPIITTYILRDQEDIDASSDEHQLTIGALYVPVLCLLVIFGVLYEYLFIRRTDGSRSEEDNECAVVNETSTLLGKDRRGSSISKQRRSDSTSVASEVKRRMSVEIEIPFFADIPNPVETKYEKELMDKLMHEQEEWEEEEKPNDQI